MVAEGGRKESTKQAETKKKTRQQRKPTKDVEGLCVNCRTPTMREETQERSRKRRSEL